jgi:tryptophan synthase alpha chain
VRSRIEEAFQRARCEGRCAFIPYLTGGFPDPESCVELLVTLDRNGADLLEVGIPFSDPLADGPTIQWSSRKALDAGVTPEGVLRLLDHAKAEIRAPIVLMTYWNPILKRGPEDFASKAKDTGVAGIIVPDLPPEEAGPWVDAAWTLGIDTIFMASPTTPLPRLERILSLCRGFLYYVSMTGVTGSELSVSRELIEHIQQIKARTRLPVAVGFGISTPRQARAFATAAHGVIVGSALIREVQAHGERTAQVEAVRRLVSSITRALSPDRTVRSC